MKYFLIIFVFTILTLPNTTLAQEKPTATIVSEDLSFCESGDVILKVKFTGEPPFSFHYKRGSATSTSPSTSEYEFDFPFAGISNSTSFELVKVFDANYPPSGEGSTQVSGAVNVTIDNSPIVEAGVDAAVCGYEHTMNGSITGSTTKIWWSDPGASTTFEDDASPTSKFTGDVADTYSLRLNAENGACKDLYDEVEITLYGRPKGTIKDISDWKYCSTDAPTHTIPLELNFEGNSDFSYILKNDAGTAKGSFVATEADEDISISIPVSDTETISFQSIEDGNGCTAESADMIGQRTAVDVKPDARAGEDRIGENPICGADFTLEAEASPGTTGKWTALVTGINFSDDTQANATATASFAADEYYRTVPLRWTETTTDGLQCADFDEVAIKFIKSPTLAITSVTDDEICEDKSTTLVLDPTGNAPFEIVYNLGGSAITESLSTSDPELDLMYPELALGNNTVNITRITDSHDCVSDLSLSQDIWVDEMPVANAGPPIDTCGVEVDLLAVQQYDDSEWLLSEGLFDDVYDPTSKFTANNTGTLNLVWRETNGRCTDTDTVIVSFYDTPRPVKEITDTVIYAANFIILPADSLTVGTGQWSIIEPTVTGATFEDDTSFKSKFSNFSADETYHLQWKATLASAPETCRERVHNVYIETHPLFAPTGISPNNDGNNDVLKIKGAENITNNKLSVFDKHGKQVISINNYGEWDHLKGKYKRWPDEEFGYEIPDPGIYLYVFEGEGISTVKNYITVKY
ncbi:MULTISPECIES: T9SS type B sorting domain-containing protein [unclassified Saccharicrinis]|uniref:T9SS type B sorting domain-containing protein n=1 Tax=unclassified Saccharicrinis TaxID=2646859 RepID=UPI003D330EAD